MQMLGYKANLTKSAFFSLCQINFYKIWNMHGVSYFSVCEHKMPTQFSRAASQSYWRETTISQTVLFFFVIFPLSGFSLWQVFMSYHSRGVLLIFKLYCPSIDHYFVFPPEKEDLSNKLPSFQTRRLLNLRFKLLRYTLWSQSFRQFESTPSEWIKIWHFND